MFGKMMKWELRETAPVYGVLYILALVTALTCRSTGEAWHDILKRNTAYSFLTVTLLATLGVYFMTVIWRYYDGLYGNRGYLTFSLPVKGWTVVLSRFLAALFWGILSAAICTGLFWLILQNQTFGENGENVRIGSVVAVSMADSFREMGLEGRTILFLGLANILCSAICQLARCFFCISLGQTFPFGKGNLVAAVVLFWLLGKIQGGIFIVISNMPALQMREQVICFSAILLVLMLLYLLGAVYLVSRKTDLR